MAAEDEEDEEIAGAYRAGETLAAIAAARGIGLYKVREALRRQQVPLRTRGEIARARAARARAAQVHAELDWEAINADGSRAALIVEMYRAGHSLRAAGHAAGVSSPDRRRGILHGAGIPFVVASGRARRVPLPPAAEVVSRYADGESSVVLGTAYGVSGDLILGILEGAGVEARDAGSALREWHSRATPGQRRERAQPKTPAGEAAMAAGVRKGGTAASARGRAARLQRDLLARRDALLDEALASDDGTRDRLVAHADGLTEAITGLETLLRATRRGR
jgi:hypothetical protein